MRKLLLSTALMFFAYPSFSAQWNVDPLTSKLMFTGEQAGEKFEGSFPVFNSQIDFDEAAPAKGSIRITINMSKLQIDGKDRMDALPTDDWFATAKFPTAEFTSTRIEAASNDKAGVKSYLAHGALTIRGISRNIDLPFTLQTKGSSTIARGHVQLSRKDFGIGQGQWKSDEWVKYPVGVSFEIHATAQ